MTLPTNRRNPRRRACLATWRYLRWVLLALLGHNPHEIRLVSLARYYRGARTIPYTVYLEGPPANVQF